MKHGVSKEEVTQRGVAQERYSENCDERPPARDQPVIGNHLLMAVVLSTWSQISLRWETTCFVRPLLVAFRVVSCHRFHCTTISVYCALAGHLILLNLKKKDDGLEFIAWPVSKSVEKRGVGKCAISQHPVIVITLDHGIKARNHMYWEIAQFPTQQPPGPQKPLGLQPGGSKPQRLPR